MRKLPIETMSLGTSEDCTQANARRTDSRIEMARATLEVRESNHSAIHIYEKYGFETVGRRKKYYQDTDEDGVIMWRGGLQRFSEGWRVMSDE